MAVKTPTLDDLARIAASFSLSVTKEDLESFRHYWPEFGAHGSGTPCGRPWGWQVKERSRQDALPAVPVSGDRNLHLPQEGAAGRHC